jgi:hypothetical protein
MTHFYPIGIPGQPWGETEKRLWLSRQTRQRSYAEDVLARINRLPATVARSVYGEIQSATGNYPLMGLQVIGPTQVAKPRPVVLITGGVHGYETSGVHGALAFVEQQAQRYAADVDLWVAPCVSPWAYEHIQRWNEQAIDPNRSFKPGTSVMEASALMAWVEPVRSRLALHIDLHETTDTDESEFRPALAARDGRAFTPVQIPDGFYVVDDLNRPAPELQQAIIRAVEAITHIAPADEQGRLIDSPIVAPGVIRTDLAGLGLCGGFTGAPSSTTEVYPDSPGITPEQCVAVQVCAICSAIDYLLGSDAFEQQRNALAHAHAHGA